MARTRSPRKDRMWITIGPGAQINVAANAQVNTNLEVVNNLGSGSDAGNVANFLRGPSGPLGDLSVATTIYAAREFTLSAVHCFGAAIVGDTSLDPAACGVAIGIQGGGRGGVSQLPSFMDNENTGIWPAVFAAIPAGLGQASGTQYAQFYSLVGHSKAMRKVKLGQSLYLSAFNQNSDNAGAHFNVVFRCLILL